MGHPQPPPPVAMYNTSANSIINGTNKKSRAIDMIFYWVRDRIRQNNFHIFWEEGKKNLADYVTKHHRICHHRTMRPIHLTATKKHIKNLKYWSTDTGRGCGGTTNPRGTWKHDNTLKVTRNPILHNPDNPLNGIWNLVPHGIHSQCPKGLTVST